MYKTAQLMTTEFIHREGGVEPEIPNDCSFSGVIDCIDKVIIEKDAFTGHNVWLLTGGHDYTKFGEERKRVGVHGPIIIHEGVWIGSCAIILGPCEIGKHSVIGAGSVVAHKNIPEYQVWAGNPCKFIKEIPHG